MSKSTPLVKVKHICQSQCYKVGVCTRQSQVTRQFSQHKSQSQVQNKHMTKALIRHSQLSQVKAKVTSRSQSQAHKSGDLNELSIKLFLYPIALVERNLWNKWQ
jgi:hypothetical protein